MIKDSADLRYYKKVTTQLANVCMNLSSVKLRNVNPMPRIILVLKTNISHALQIKHFQISKGGSKTSKLSAEIFADAFIGTFQLHKKLHNSRNLQKLAETLIFLAWRYKNYSILRSSKLIPEIELNLKDFTDN